MKILSDRFSKDLTKNIVIGIVLLCGIFLLIPGRASAATASVKSLSLNKTYKNYDITSDGKADRIKIAAKMSDDEYCSCSIYINSKCALNLKNLDQSSNSCFAITAKLITLKNNKKFLYLALGGEDGDGIFSIYQYKSGKLQKAVNLSSVLGSGKYFSHYSVNSLTVTGNIVTAKLYAMSATLGVSYYKYTFSYKKGSLCKDSNTGTISRIYKLDNSSSTNCKLCRTIKGYQSIGAKTGISLKKNTSVKFVNIYYSAKKGMWLKLKAGSKYYWIKALTSYSNPIIYHTMLAR